MNDPPTSVSRRADACALLFGLVLPTVMTWMYFVAASDWGTEIRRISYGVGKTVQFSFPLVWVLAVQRRRLRLRMPAREGLAEGIGFGLLVLAAMLLIFFAWVKPAGLLGDAAVEVRQMLGRFGVDTATKYVGLGVFYCVIHSLLEEYYFRWFLFGGLRRLVSLWPAVLISSLGFMGHHVLVLGQYLGGLSVATVFFSLSVAVGGAVWAWIYHRSDSLYGPWVSHLLVDVGIFVIGYQILGGRFGP